MKESPTKVWFAIAGSAALATIVGAAVIAGSKFAFTKIKARVAGGEG